MITVICVLGIVTILIILIAAACMMADDDLWDDPFYFEKRK